MAAEASQQQQQQEAFPGEGSWRSSRRRRRPPPPPLPDAEPRPRAERGRGRPLRSPQRGRRGVPRDEAWPGGGGDDDGAPRWPSRPPPEGSEWWGRSPRQQQEGEEEGEEEEGARWGRPGSPPGRKRQKRPWGSPGREAPGGGGGGEAPRGRRRRRSWSSGSPERRAVELEQQRQPPAPLGRRRPSVGPGSPPRRPRSPRGDDPRGWGSPHGEPGPSQGGRRRSSPPQRQGRGRGRQQQQQASGGRQARSPDGDPGGWGDPGWEPGREGPQGWDPPRRGRSGSSGGRWSSPERRGGGRRRQQGGPPGSPERLRRQPVPGGDPRGWGWFQGDPGGSWSSPEGRGGDRQSPRGQRAWGSPARGEGQQGSGRFGSPRPLDSEQGPGNWGGLPPRGARAQALSRAGSSHRLQSSNGGQQRGGRATLFGGGWDPREADGGSCERGGEEEGGPEEGAPQGSGSPAETAAGLPGAPLGRWTPREAVAQYWVQCQAILSRQKRKQLLSACPQPALPNRMAEVPGLNTDIALLLNARDLKELGAASRPLWGLQEELLEMLGPAMTIYEMAEEAIETEEAAVDATELWEWTRRLIRYIGSLNQRLTAQRRMQALGAISPRLKCVTSKMASLCPNGKLFAEDKVQLLKEIIQRFPQLTEAKKKAFPRKYQPFSKRAPNVAAYGQRRSPLGPHSHPWDSGAQAQGQSPADHQMNQDHP